MIFVKGLLGCLSILIILCFPMGTLAKVKDMKVLKEEGPVEIEADHLLFEREDQLYQAHGHVEVTRGSFSLRADHARLSAATNIVVAWGNVILREGEDVLECERLEVNLDTQKGKVYQAKLFLKEQNFHITGQEVEKLGEGAYRVREGSVTTCDAKRPPWKFTVKEMEVTVKGGGIAKGPIFYVEDTPVLYLPVAMFPVKQERQTGFLLPEVGYSSEFGPEVKTAFYWAMRKDMDATVYLSYLGDRGFKEGLEYRYALANETKGQASFHFIDDHVFDGKRYGFFFQHEQKLPHDFYLKGDVNQVSDRFYTEDFDEDLPDKTDIDAKSLRYLRSVLFGGKNWDRFSLLAEGVVFYDLIRDDRDRTDQKLPQIGFYAHPQALFKTPLFYDFPSSYNYFWKEEGTRAHRWDFLPRISYPLRILDVLKVDSSVGFRETLYKTVNDPVNERNGWKSRETFEAAAGVSTEFYRVYEGSSVAKISDLFKVARWMHTIEPGVSYQYIPKVAQEDLPNFDQVDRIPFTSQITYGITQRLVGKPAKEGIDSGPYEYWKLKVFQSYSLGDPYLKDGKGKERYFSNIIAQLWWNSTRYLTARGNAEFNPYEGSLEQLNGLVRLKDQRNDAIQVEYSYTRDRIQGINLYTRMKTIDPLYLYGAFHYNLLEKTWVQNVYGTEYQAQCWTAGLIITQDKNRSPDRTLQKEVKFQAYLNLLGLGALGHKPRFLNLLMAEK